jgi:nucleotide sugar dehydrogenase
MRICVVGGGRMGLPLACALAGNGAEVVVCDINAELVASIAAGVSPYDEPQLPGLIAQMHQARRLTASTDTAASVAACDVAIVIVPAHLTADRDIDLSILASASRDIGRGLRRGTLVIYETTVAVGSTRRKLIPILEEASGLEAGTDFHVGYSPERVKANLVFERLHSTPKVVGGLDALSCAKTAEVYRTFLGAPVQDVGTLEAAEMTKLLGMLFRDVNIALANELAAFCEISGVDFDKVREAANGDGEANLLIPGIGVGGHCTPIYPYFLTKESRRLGMAQRLSEAAREINDQQPARQLERVAAAWGSFQGRRVHILGLAFRPEVKVDTLSPAYTLRDELRQRGAAVTIDDPYFEPDELIAAGFEPGLPTQAELVILNTAHGVYGGVNFAEWKRAGVQAVLDGRNLWNQANVESAGLHYFGIGRGVHSVPSMPASVGPGLRVACS